MADKQIYIRPRRGTKTVMHETEKAVLVLKEGEVFFEFPDEGVGKGPAKVKIGDGISAYVALPYALGDAIETETVDFLEDHRTDIDALFRDFVTGKTVQILIPVIKRIMELLNTTVQNLVLNLGENYYTKDEVYNKNETYNKTELYSKNEIDDDFYKKSQLYTKTEIDDDFYKKSETYTRIEIIDLIHQECYTKAETYSKEEIDEKIKIPVVNADPANPEVGDRWVVK